MFECTNIDLAWLDRIVDRAAGLPRWWVVLWVVVIVGVTLTAIVCHAPTLVHVIVIILVLVLFAGDRFRTPA